MLIILNRCHEFVWIMVVSMPHTLVVSSPFMKWRDWLQTNSSGPEEILCCVLTGSTLDLPCNWSLSSHPWV